MAYLAFFGFLAFFPLALIYGTWAWAFVIQKSWGWFVVSPFSLQPLTFQQAIALGAMVGLFFLRNSPYKPIPKNPDGSNDWSEFSTGLITAIISPWIALFFNWITYLIFM